MSMHHFVGERLTIVVEFDCAISKDTHRTRSGIHSLWFIVGEVHATLNINYHIPIQLPKRSRKVLLLL
jgi:hypothetical protein